MTRWPSKNITNINSTTNSNKYYRYQRKLNLYNVYTNYSVRNIAAFCSAKKDLKTLCLKLASKPFFSNIGIHTVPVLYSPNSESTTSFCFSFILGANQTYVRISSGSIMNF